MIKVDIKLRRDNFDVRINETFKDGITGIFGPSGSGKTSLLHSIAGLAKPYEGEIIINNKKVYSTTEHIHVPVEKRNIGYVFQEGRLFPHMTVEKNLLYGVKKVSDGSLGFTEVVEMLNLKHVLKSKPSNISGGERQRTALGRSLLSSPDLLLLDEPFSAVDAGLRDQILPFLFKIHKTVNIPILVVSHDITDLLKLTQQLFLIQSGRCLGHDDYLQLLKKKEVQHIINSKALINAVTMKVTKTNTETGLSVLAYNGSSNEIKVLCEKCRTEYKPGEEIKIFIRSDDIALSTEKLNGITIQNQLKGIITDIIERESIRLILVDVGFPLVVEITSESLKRMEMAVGRTVYCLFKSVAIDLVG